jgi:hypothetical protein
MIQKRNEAKNKQTEAKKKTLKKRKYEQTLPSPITAFNSLPLLPSMMETHIIIIIIIVMSITIIVIIITIIIVITHTAPS